MDDDGNLLFASGFHEYGQSLLASTTTLSSRTRYNDEIYTLTEWVRFVWKGDRLLDEIRPEDREETSALELKQHLFSWWRHPPDNWVDIYNL